ncbi:hypothetical protein A2866_01675 [Candidatus Roizmanbacteria bacterium RIFCSPHIGHO2_01_FULL_39_8]|uniref:Glycosyl transferase family 1 domain-containing protein n=3 Tax=Candidatus Roizmaniibacteriota TaxID=1752723 RepID=A0A1F7GKD0_9BACT|nr:MAG: hypothetical protein A2866_01675 [Candidatus Roizmanbacteria bacterium RIFCSPHIGHO2_01_FULL_39_8]OGK25682.1 MAG: hypothetical protein A3C28_01445 [Candidatus Roizmanbacteria bacterium RIFCSPHIGHO2_02_FULL_39_9]
MKIGLLEPSLLMSNRYADRVFAPKDLFLHLADGLVKKGNEVYAFTASDVKTTANILPGNKELEKQEYPSVRDGLKKTDLINALTLIRNHYEYEVDVISRAFYYSNSNNFDVLHSQSNVFTHYFVKLSGIPVVFTLHDPVFPQNSLEFSILKMFTSHNYIAISNKQAEMYRKIMNINPVAVIYHGIKLDDFVFSQTSENYISMIGRYIPEKGFEDAIASSIKQNVQLKIASSPNYQKTDYYLQKIKPFLNKNIMELNFLKEDQRNIFLMESKIMLMPIKWEEPFGMVMIEAMACGTPVVAYARGSVPEVIKDGETGLIVNPSEEDKRGDWIIKKTGLEGLCEAVERIYSMPENQYRQMRQNCRAHVEEYFTVEEMINNYEKAYQKIIDKQ